MTFKKTISQLSIDESLLKFDATNACVFLAIDICDKILLSKENVSSESIVASVQDIILTRPEEYNKSRDNSLTYQVMDALNCIGDPLINNGSIQFINLASEELRQQISSTIFNGLSITRHGFYKSVPIV